MRILADARSTTCSISALEEAFARQRSFVSDASHELRTPLTAIRGQVEVLARNEHPDAAEVRRVERLVQAEVARMTRLTEDLLLLARTEESRFIDREAVDLELLLEDLLASAEPTADRRFSLAADVPGIINADRDRITQALRQPLACCATPSSTPSPAAASSSEPARSPGSASRSGSTMTDRASRRPSESSCSTASTAPTRRGRAPPAGPVWGSRSSARS